MKIQQQVKIDKLRMLQKTTKRDFKKKSPNVLFVGKEIFLSKH